MNNKLKVKLCKNLINSLLCAFGLIVFHPFQTNANQTDSLKMEAQYLKGMEYWGEEKFDSAFYHFNSAIQLSKEFNYPLRTGKFILLKANIYYDNEQTKKTFETIEEAKAFYRQANIESGEPLSLLYEGYFYEEVGDYGKAIITYKRGVELSKQIKDTTKIGTLLNNLSVSYHALGDNESAIEYLLEAIHYREAEHSPNIGISYANLGNAYKRQENFSEAIVWYQKSLDAMQGDNFARARIVCLRNMGDTYAKLDNFKEAEKKFKASYKIAKELGNNNGNIAMYHFFMGSLQLDLNKIDSAQYNFNQAVNFFPSEGFYIFRSNNFNKLARIFIQRGENQSGQKQFFWNQAIKNGEAALELAEKAGALKQINAAANTLMNAHAKAQNPNKTLQYAELYGNSLDSLNRLERSKKVIEMQTKFEVEKKELQIELLGKENVLKEADLQQTKKSEAQQRLIALISFIALLVAAFSALFLYRLYGQKKKANAELETKNTLISEQKEEKEVLLKEIHHRVKNNLQVVSSLLDLQTNNIEDESTLIAIEDGQSRVQAMALIHQNLYQNQDISSISFEEYANQLVKQLASVYQGENKVEVELKSEKVYFDIDTAIPIGLILNELVSNAYKYAFNNEPQGKLSIKLEAIGEGEYCLAINDNGSGLPESFNLSKTKSLGLRLVHRLSRQLYGKAEYFYEQGAIFKILFKDTNQRKLVQ